MSLKAMQTDLFYALIEKTILALLFVSEVVGNGMIVCINLVFSKTMRFEFTAVIFTFIKRCYGGWEVIFVMRIRR